MRLSKDVRDFIELLNSTSTEFLVVGGHAVRYHGFPRVTGDFDFFVRASEENALRLIEVFRQFGFEDADKLRTVFTTGGPGKLRIEAGACRGRGASRFGQSRTPGRWRRAKR